MAERRWTRSLDNNKVKPMDNLAERLREDAASIDATISPELEARIHASLHAVRPAEETPKASAKPWSFWLASSLTGAVIAVAAIAFLATRSPEPGDEPTVARSPEPVEAPSDALEIPALRLNAETAVLKAPLQEELDALQSDLKKVEQKVRDDMGL